MLGQAVRHQPFQGRQILALGLDLVEQPRQLRRQLRGLVQADGAGARAAAGRGRHDQARQQHAALQFADRRRDVGGRAEQARRPAPTGRPNRDRRSASGAAAGWRCPADECRHAPTGRAGSPGAGTPPAACGRRAGWAAAPSSPPASADRRRPDAAARPPACPRRRHRRGSKERSAYREAGDSPSPRLYQNRQPWNVRLRSTSWRCAGVDTWYHSPSWRMP